MCFSVFACSLTFTQGKGLGKEGSGIVEPIAIRKLPPNTALDFISAKQHHRSDTTAADGKWHSGDVFTC
jgi:G-patch domain